MRLIIHSNPADGQLRRFNSATRSGASRCLGRFQCINMHDPQRGNDALDKHRTRTDAVKVSLDRVRISKPRLILSNNSAATAKSDQMDNEYKLHLVIDRDSYARLGWLKANLGASTDGEVIRRALKAYEIFEPNDAVGNDPKGPNLGHFYPEKDVEHIYIRLPARMKERLDYEREKTGRSYGEQVRQALRVLMQLAREREKLLAEVSRGGDVNAKRGSKSRYAYDRSVSWHSEAYQKLVVLC